MIIIVKLLGILQKIRFTYDSEYVFYSQQKHFSKSGQFRPVFPLNGRLTGIFSESEIPCLRRLGKGGFPDFLSTTANNLYFDTQELPDCPLAKQTAIR